MSNATGKSKREGSEERAAIAAAQRAARRAARHGNSIADWGTADPDLIVALIDRATKPGGLVSFGYTRDQGAYTVGFLNGDDRFTEYCRPTEDLGTFLRMLCEDFE